VKGRDLIGLHKRKNPPSFLWNATPFIKGGLISDKYDKILSKSHPSSLKILYFYTAIIISTGKDE
jgi:hypothetical protein